ncbi:sensor histidine kinase [Aliiglaciecola litoralis]|uniref:histidine kinase n=1 Tax=Aliiglaciecola litoralis TaxID=582857 RepID=A0ABP3WQR5_9ALTE
MTTSNKELLAEIQRQQALLQARLNEEQHNLNMLAKRLWAQQESEKAKLSRELHDGVGQLLTGLTRRLQTLSSTQPELYDLAQLAEMALSDVRQLSRLMSPTILDDLGLVPAIKWLCRSLFEHESCKYECEFDCPLPIPQDISILIFRIVQEALVNIIKHADASQAKIMLSCHHQTIRLDIIDNGVGFEHKGIEKGIGLNSMKDRAQAFNADLIIYSKIDKGSRVTLTVQI